MKRITALAAALLLAAVPAFSQIIPGAGYLNSTLTSNTNGNVSSVVQDGFYAGASVNLDLGGIKGLSFVPGAYVSFITSTGTRGADLIVISGTSTSTFTEIALNAPARLKYGLSIGDGAKIYAFAGPVFQFGILSQTNTNTKSTNIISGEHNTTNVSNWYTEGRGYNRFNIYIGGGVGVEYGRFGANIGYDYGLMNVYRGYDKVSGNRANLVVGVSYAL